MRKMRLRRMDSALFLLGAVVGMWNCGPEWTEPAPQQIEYPSPQPPTMEKLLEDLRSPYDVRVQAAADEVAKRGAAAHAAVPLLIECLGLDALAARKPDYIAREHCGRALGEIGDPRAVLPLAAMLRDPIDGVREVAAEALGRLGPAAAPAVPALVRLLSSDLQEYPRSLQAATAALAQIGEPALPALFEALADENQSLWATTAIARIGPVALPGLKEVLANEGPRASGAAEALRELGPPGAPLVPALVEAFQQGRISARNLARASQAIGPGAALAVPELTELLRSKSDRTRTASADALKAIGAEARSAIPELEAALAVENDVQSRNAMQEALTELQREPQS